MKERLVALLATATAVAATWVAIDQIITFSVSAAETSTLAIAVKVSGQLSADDKRGLLFTIGGYNESIYLTNGVPLATNNATALKASYEIVLSNRLQQAHASYMKDAKSTAAAKALIGNDDVSAQISAAVIDAIVAGKSIQQIITAIGQ